MAYVTLGGSSLGTPLQEMLCCDYIQPGAAASYQTAKTIFSYHPLGAKMAEAPVSLSQSQRRTISVGDNAPERLVKAFNDEWEALGCDKLIFNLMRLSRVYGLASLALMPGENETADTEVDFAKLYKMPILNFNVFDPLNTSGSLVLNQQPNDNAFLKLPTGGFRVGSTKYHPSRSIVKMNEDPIYLEYTSSAFGFVGRSVYQRALFPLKSFIQSMQTDDLITLKCGVIIAKLKQAGAIITQTMLSMFGIKRNVVKEAQIGNVISIDVEEGIETLNMQNLDGAYTLARSNILKNIATAADMPARLLENETFASGLADGTEDAKAIAQYVERFRIEMNGPYAFFDNIVMYRAWNPELFAELQAEFPEEFCGVSYNEAFSKWKSAFSVEWPSLLREPESEKAQAEDVKLKGIIAVLEVMVPQVDPVNKSKLMEWAADNINTNKVMFPVALELDWEELRDYVPPAAAANEEPKPGHPFAAQDSAATNIRRLG